MKQISYDFLLYGVLIYKYGREYRNLKNKYISDTDVPFGCKDGEYNDLCTEFALVGIYAEQKYF